MNVAIVESHIVGAQTFELRSVPCGKKNCTRCPHGPYWYVKISLRSGRMVQRYIGKEMPAEVAGLVGRA